MLPKGYSRPALDKVMLGELISLCPGSGWERSIRRCRRLLKRRAAQDSCCERFSFRGALDLLRTVTVVEAEVGMRRNGRKRNEVFANTRYGCVPAACDYYEARKQKQKDPVEWCAERYHDNAAAYRFCVNGSPDR